MMDWYGGWGWGAWLVMSLMMLIFWGAIVVGVIALVRWLGADRARDSSHRSDAHDLLDERFARGDIDEDDYRRRRELLGGR